MKILKYVIHELKQPDDQGCNWYAWTTNQLSHLLLGLISASLLLILHFYHFFLYAIGAFFVGFEVRSIIKTPTFAMVIDKINDIFFFISGEFLGYFIYYKNTIGFIIVLFIVTCFLTAGITSRVKKAFDNYQRDNDD